MEVKRTIINILDTRIRIIDYEIDEVEETKFLGVTIDIRQQTNLVTTSEASG